MQGTTRLEKAQLRVGALGHGLVVVSIIALAVIGQVVPEQAGWVMGAPSPGGALCRREWSQGERVRATSGPPALWLALVRTGQIALLRSLLLWGMWQLSGQVGPRWLCLWPWAFWGWRSVGLAWPGVRRRASWSAVEHWLEWGQRWLTLGYVGLVLTSGLQQCWGGGRMADQPARGHAGALPTLLGGAGLGWQCQLCGREEPQVTVERQADGSYQATLCGHFTLQVAGDSVFRMRLLLLFLSLLTRPGPQRKGRRTRDGRTPFVSQMQLGAWFGMPHPHVSRLYKYWLSADWANLLSLYSAEVLTTELRERIVEVCASFPRWGPAEVRQHLRSQGVLVSLPQVEQVFTQSGWAKLRQTVFARYDLAGAMPHLRDGWLVGQLLAQVQDLLERLEAGQSVPPEQRIAITDLQQLAVEAQVVSAPPLKTEPWLLRIEQRLFAAWQTPGDDQVHCPACGSTDIKRKGHKPRLKKYYDADHQVQQVAVYRYFCCNPGCPTQTFTDLPAGLLPYSPHRTETHLLALQMYAWGYSTYRRTGTALGVASLTAWRWVSAWGYSLLPVAALFGVLKSSGVVDVDEKYVLVPKNDKPAGEMRRWMYVYLAVDAWTYDLLHIALYPNNDDASAQAFLLALRAKGYHPQVIVTDLRQDYGPVIAQVFPQAVHHECLFHALQNVQKHIKDAYGKDYQTRQPEAERLKHLIYTIFEAQTPLQAEQRYAEVLALQPACVQAQPQAQAIFDFLDRHWPKLVNAIGSELIPTTNNTVERVIGRFDQHYQNFCGFESQSDAERYLAVFEKLYRFTPFSQDAKPSVRGKTPLQLAGYDISQLPMATICSGRSIDWPTGTAHVPSP
jgi:transposase-like protein